MKWFKHDADANMDAKLQEILLDYGLEGYGLYWYCLELITSKVEADNVTFQVEHDARIIARNTGCSVQRVQEMMSKFVELGLFENVDGIITCLKLARRIDKSMTSNPHMREIIGNLNKSHDSVMIQSCEPMQDKIRLDKSRVDNTIYKHIDLSALPIEISANDQKSFIDYKIAWSSKNKKPAPTDRAIQMSLNQAVKINKDLGITYDEIFGTVEEKGWSGIKFDYFTNQQFNGSFNQPAPQKQQMSSFPEMDN